MHELSPPPDDPKAVCPINTLMSVLSGPWTLYLLWVLSTKGPQRFGELRRQINGISTKVLTERLRMLEAEGIAYRDYKPTIPPEVTYGLTARGGELMEILDQLASLANRWYGEAPSNEGDRQRG
ncbi:MAG: helix-turn-helix transcriptional regulator [Stenomitos rutilans HA7619-LM2]|jgi:DNA-binding HxlR family transcriptional regulator|nr:helix-turn-helix transcriptional regulator [Stenomitos rutilans HA7619-LM2]